MSTEEQQEPASFEQGPRDSTAQHALRILSSEGEISRFDRWIEFLSAAVLALATVATAWCGYQAAIWGGNQTEHMARANQATVQSAQFSNTATQIKAVHANLFVAWASALSEGNRKLADFLYQRFPAELKTATDAWMTTQPLTNTNAPKTPFQMPEYIVAESNQAAAMDALARTQMEQATNANTISDRYVLLTVIFASVLFFGGVSGKFQSRAVDLAMLILAAVIFTIGLFIVVTFPVELGG
jgi:hypothetical protein